ncbi:MAG: PAS domain S-box protein [Desulfuromonadales bacterium]|nr:MAG: PAS domain S-box protein [Desulfuromonadales bacterium]
MTGIAILAAALAILYIRRWLELRREVARRIKAEEMLRRSRDFQLSLFDDFPTLVWRTGVDGRCDYVNREWLQFTGLQLDEALADGWVNLIHPADLERVGARRDAAYGARQPFEAEFRFRRHDGEYRWIVSTGRPYQDLEGNFGGYIGSSYDITERITTEQALRVSEKRFRETFENIRLIAVRIGTDGTVEFCNDFFLELVGWGRAEVIGANWFDRFVPPDQVTVRKVFFASIREGRIPTHFQNDIVTRSGARRFISWTNTVLRDFDGTVTGTMSIGEDITDRSHAENTLLMYQEQLSNLAAELSRAEERERRRLATGLHDKIGQSLAFAKIKAGSLREHLAGTGGGNLSELTELLDQVIQDVRTLIFEISPPLLYEVGLEAALEWLAENFQKEHGIRVDYEDDGEPKPLGEEMKVTLFQVAREVLINTAKHALAGRVELSVRRNNRRVILRIADDGKGFDVARVADSKRSGAGFGLFNISQRIEHLGGQVVIDSRPGQGAVVTVVAPLGAGHQGH